MRKVLVLLTLIPAMVSCVVACSSHADVICDDPVKQHSDRVWQSVEIARHIKFEKDSFFLDITLEEAMQKGISADIYQKKLERLEEDTRTARRILATGGKFYFVNGLVENGDLSNNYHSSRIVGYSGYLECPGFTRGYIRIIPQHADSYKGVAFSCNAQLGMKAAGGDYTGFVRHECYISGKDKDGHTVDDGIIAIGSPATSALPVVPFPGLIGDSAEDHSVTYHAELEVKDAGDSLIKGWCNYMAVTDL